MQQTTSLLQQQPVVDNVLGVAGGEKINEATLYVNLTPREEREISQKQFEQQMRSGFQEIPGARIGFQAQGAAGADKDLQIVLKTYIAHDKCPTGLYIGLLNSCTLANIGKSSVGAP